MNWETLFALILAAAVGVHGLISFNILKKIMPPPPVRVPLPQAMDSIKSSLQDICQQLDTPFGEEGDPEKQTAILSLHRNGIPGPEIARHLHMSGGEVDLIIQVDRTRSQRRPKTGARYQLSQI